MKIQIQAIVNLLRKYEARYRWLDVFASEVRELTEASEISFQTLQEKRDTYRFHTEGQEVELVLDRSRNLARFRLIKGTPYLTGALIGAGVGGLLSGMTTTNARDSSAAGVLLGLLVGGLAGAGIAAMQGDEEPEANENRILTLAFEPNEQTWKVYHGPYRDYAKEALHPASG